MSLNIPGVTSLTETGVTPAIQGAVTLTEGSNITITQSGQAITIAAAGGATPQWKFATIFETAARAATTLVGSGVVTFGNAGVETASGATGTSSAKARWLSNQTQVDLYASTSNFSQIVQVNAASTSGADTYFGVADNITVDGTSITYTGKHYGFKIVYAAGTATLSATNADGTTETATDITSGVTVTSDNLYHAIKTGTTNVVYYTNRTSRATHTTNLPASMAVGDRLNTAVSNKGNAVNIAFISSSYNYEQNAE